VIFPAFIEGVASQVNVAVDIVVAIILILLVGWQMAIVPSFIVEKLPSKVKKLAGVITDNAISGTFRRMCIDVEIHYAGLKPGSASTACC